mmetsp:Transcript_109768/g.321364  ORF Transcript_109768/g.321364 Transcript_109768/m.321364 type:complete len:234 (+) Transcript_109768:491-1192(+)
MATLSFMALRVLTGTSLPRSSTILSQISSPNFFRFSASSASLLWASSSAWPRRSASSSARFSAASFAASCARCRASSSAFSCASLSALSRASSSAFCASRRAWRRCRMASLAAMRCSSSSSCCRLASLTLRLSAAAAWRSRFSASSRASSLALALSSLLALASWRSCACAAVSSLCSCSGRQRCPSHALHCKRRLACANAHAVSSVMCWQESWVDRQLRPPQPRQEKPSISFA